MYLLYLTTSQCQEMKLSCIYAACLRHGCAAKLNEASLLITGVPALNNNKQQLKAVLLTRNAAYLTPFRPSAPHVKQRPSKPPRQPHEEGVRCARGRGKQQASLNYEKKEEVGKTKVAYTDPTSKQRGGSVQGEEYTDVL